MTLITKALAKPDWRIKPKKKKNVSIKTEKADGAQDTKEGLKTFIKKESKTQKPNKIWKPVNSGYKVMKKKYQKGGREQSGTQSLLNKKGKPKGLFGKNIIKKENIELIKGVKRKSEDETEASGVKKIKLAEMKKKERKIFRKKIDNKSFDLSTKLKILWDEERRGDCKPDRKLKLVEEMCLLSKGHVKKLVFAHDTVRVLESMISGGNNRHRALLMEEVKDDVIILAKSKFAKFFLIKMLSYGSKQQKEFIMKAFHGNVTKLIKHTEAAAVVETAFNECANAAQRSDLVQEFYGASYKFFKSSESQTLQQLLVKVPEQKAAVITHMKEHLLRILEKSVVKHSIVHYVLLQFMKHCDATSRSEVIESLREAVPEILHTRDGSRVAMHCIWHGTAKDRKAIVKHLKQLVVKAAMEEHGHMVLLALFDCIDDTRMLEKHIVMGLIKSLWEVSQNVHGRKVLIYLLSPRDSHFFCPSIINILKEGDTNTSSKKDVSIRHAELKAMIEQPLLQLIKSHLQEMYTNNSSCLFMLTILRHTSGVEIFEMIAESAVDSYIVQKKNVHVIEHPGSSFLLKQLILQDLVISKDDDDKVLFSEVLIKRLPEGVLRTWIDCNRGCFLLLSLFESGIPSVVERIRSEMKGLNSSLQKKSYKGAELLVKKLKES